MLSNIIIALVVLMTILSGASAYMYYTHDVTDHDEVILDTRVPMTLKGLVLDNPSFVNMYYVDGELACSTDKGTISLMVGGSVGILIGLLIPTVKIFLSNRFYFEVGRKNNRRVRR